MEKKKKISDKVFSLQPIIWFKDTRQTCYHNEHGIRNYQLLSLYISHSPINKNKIN